MSGVFFLSGISMATFTASGIFFLKFWRGSGDKFFLYFSIACWMLALERVAGLFMDFAYPGLTIRSEAFSAIYLCRLAAFTLIFFAVYHKNSVARAHRPKTPPTSPKVGNMESR